MDFQKMIHDCLNDNWERIQKELREHLERWKNRCKGGGKSIMFGASEMCRVCISHLEKLGIKIDIICDNDSKKHGEFITDSGKQIRIVSVAEAMADESEKLCFVAVGAQHFEAISSQLKQYRITETVMKWRLDFYLMTVVMVCAEAEHFIENIEELLGFYEDEESFKIIWAHLAMLFDLENVPETLKEISMEKLCTYPQYFLEDGRYLGKQGIMVDCGAYTGDTLEGLASKIKYDEFQQYDCYEMMPSNYAELKKTVDKLPLKVQNKIRTYNVGVGEEEISCKAVFDGTGSHIQHNGDVEIKIVRLDDIYADTNVTFLKMDVEGSEQAAIRGGRNMISRCRPMCAICIYHWIEAFWEVPRLLKECVPEYKMILRHHSDHWDETVCYAKTGEWK